MQDIQQSTLIALAFLLFALLLAAAITWGGHRGDQRAREAEIERQRRQAAFERARREHAEKAKRHGGASAA